MKQLKSAIFIVVFGSLITSQVIANDLNRSHSFKKLSKSLCDITRNDQVLKMRSALRKHKSHIRNIYPYVSCEGRSLMNFALANQSFKIAAFLESKAKTESALVRFQISQLSN